MHSFTVEQVKAILSEITERMGEAENRARLDAAKEAAGNDMLKMMQCVFPLVVQIESEVIGRHGFAAGKEGMLHFTRIVRDAEPLDADVARMHAHIRSHFLPPLAITSTFD